ncbi:response regulator transcription factor [Enterobacter sichuanensis]|uniref:response regulator transcription factor n=1 Tax=Enterobacter sichuanensis TaxID=2071710 RepID=UPI00078B3C27|nr:response regulator transcription factor [Enterobacter sichuanensis]AMJ33966.1 response regulator receiver domain protein [uncultured bacterium]MEA5171766.1 response regulator transcription factor [Enterobacter sichuanensis]
MAPERQKIMAKIKTSLSHLFFAHGENDIFVTPSGQSGMSDKKVILLDVSSLLRTGIQGLLAEHGYQTAAQFLTIEAMHSALPELHADLIIMEHLQQSPEVFSHLVQIRKTYPAIKVLILSSSSSDFHIQLSRRAGASGYINKNSSLDKIINTVNTITTGGYCYGSELWQHHARYPRDASLLLSLSHIDMCILRYISAGYSNQIIASLLNMNNKKVSAYKQRIMAKFNMTRLAELVDLAKRNYLY